TDFGLARAVDDASVSQSGTVAGTPMYMSPEQAEGLPIDHRSDLFSLGTVLYAMCTGHPPFRASGTHAVLRRVIDASPRPIREINNEIPDWLCDIIGKLHAKKPEDRFQSAKEVAELLGQHLAHLQQPSIVAPPPRVETPVQQPTDWILTFSETWGCAGFCIALVALSLITTWIGAAPSLVGSVFFGIFALGLFGIAVARRGAGQGRGALRLGLAGLGCGVLALVCVAFFFDVPGFEQTTEPTQGTVALGKPFFFDQTGLEKVVIRNIE